MHTRSAAAHIAARGRPGVTRSRIRGETGRKGAAGLLLGLTLLLLSCSATPPLVERITLVNPTAYDLDVEVTDRTREGWLPMSIVEAESEDIAEDVIDQGDLWVFRFLHSGDSIGELSLARAELERSGWRVEVPEEVGERLQQLGRSTSPESSAPEGGGDLE